MCYILIIQYPPFCSLVRKQKACANEQNHVCKDSSITKCTSEYFPTNHFLPICFPIFFVEPLQRVLLQFLNLNLSRTPVVHISIELNSLLIKS